MPEQPPHERELEQEFLRRSETKKGTDLFAVDRERAQAYLRELEAKEGGAPLRSLHED
jgi:hypothetical protein